MEEKFNDLIEIIKFLVEVDHGIANQYTDSIIKMLNELKG